MEVSEIENHHTPTSIETLNDDCLLEIFSYFSFTETLTLDMVCKRWSALCLRSWEKVRSLRSKQILWSFGNECSSFHKEFITEDMLKEILIRCGRFITILDISWLDADMDQLREILPLCPNLRHVEICTIPSAIAVQSLMDNCANLESLRIDGISRKLERELSILISKNENLKYFHIRSSSGNTTGEFLKYLLGDVIEEITLGSDFVFEPYFLILAMKRFNCLRSFAYVPNIKFDDSIIETIGEKKTLTKLSLRHNYLSQVSSGAYYHLANLVNLVDLDLTLAKSLNDEALINILNNCELLQSLDISFCISITNSSVASVAKLTKLRMIRMESLDKVTDEPIGNFPNTLETLTCSDCSLVKDQGIIKLLGRAPKLNLLRLNECPITKRTMAAAIEVAKRRTNGIVLKINVYDTNIKASDVTEKPPLLKIAMNTSIYVGHSQFSN